MSDLDLAALFRRTPEQGAAFGTLMLSSSPAFASALAGCGVDMVFVDTEHVPLDRGELAHQCFAFRNIGIPPLVRIPKGESRARMHSNAQHAHHEPLVLRFLHTADAVMARAVIDAGACGVVASYTETVEQVQELARAVKLRPLQGALLEVAMCEPERFARENKKTASFIRARNASLALVLNIESAEAIRNLDALLAVPGVDGILVGPHDLSCSLGVPEGD